MILFALLIASVTLIFAFISNALPCGPSYVTPVFEYSYAPENPYENFASGRLGIIKPGFHRSVRGQKFLRNNKLPDLIES